MDVHLITTDQTSFKLLESINGALNVTSVIVPANRRHTRKVAGVVKMAECRQIPVYIHHLRSQFPRNLPPACAAICWLYSQIICEQDLARYPMGILNMHGGKLPQYRGASVLQWAIINGESETPGGVIKDDGFLENPLLTNSSVDLSYSQEERLTCSTISSSTIETQNSLVSFIFNNVSFCFPVLPLFAGENPMIGGLEPNPLKYENGAKLSCPFESWEETKAIGRGDIPEIIKLYISLS